MLITTAFQHFCVVKLPELQCSSEKLDLKLTSIILFQNDQQTRGLDQRTHRPSGCSSRWPGKLARVPSSSCIARLQDDAEKASGSLYLCPAGGWDRHQHHSAVSNILIGDLWDRRSEQNIINHDSKSYTKRSLLSTADLLVQTLGVSLQCVVITVSVTLQVKPGIL